MLRLPRERRVDVKPKLKDIQSKILILKSFNVLKNFTRSHIGRIMRNMQVIKVKAGEFLIKQDNPLSRVFFMINGKVEVLHTHVNQLSLEVGMNLIASIDSASGKRFTERRKDELKGKLKSSTLKRLFTIENRGVLGDVEFALKGEKSIFSIKCINDSLFYAIDRLDLRINLKDSQFEALNKEAFKKKDKYMARIREIKEVKDSKNKLKHDFRDELLSKIDLVKREKSVKKVKIEIEVPGGLTCRNLMGKRAKSVEHIKPIKLLSSKAKPKFKLKKTSIFEKISRPLRGSSSVIGMAIKSWKR